MNYVYFLLGEPPLPYFAPRICNDSSYISDSCNISMNPCDALKPCRNSGNCTNEPNITHDYSCECQLGFNGTICEYDIRLCKPNTCLYNGKILLHFIISHLK